MMVMKTLSNTISLSIVTIFNHGNRKGKFKEGLPLQVIVDKYINQTCKNFANNADVLSPFLFNLVLKHLVRQDKFKNSTLVWSLGRILSVER